MLATTQRPTTQRDHQPPESGQVEAAPGQDESAPTVEFGPLLVRTVLVTTVSAVLGIGLPMWWLTGQVWDGVGLGVFTAFWGGPGFGLMIAGAIWTHRLEQLDQSVGEMSKRRSSDPSS